MKFGSLWENCNEAKSTLNGRYGNDLAGNTESCDYYKACWTLKSSDKVVYDAQQQGFAAHMKYSGYDDQYEYVQYSNGYNKYKRGENNPYAQFDTIEIQYRDESGYLRNQWAVDIDKDGEVDENEIFDTRPNPQQQ